MNEIPERDLQPTEDLPERPEQTYEEARQREVDDLNDLLRDITRSLGSAK